MSQPQQRELARSLTQACQHTALLVPAETSLGEENANLRKTHKHGSLRTPETLKLQKSSSCHLAGIIRITKLHQQAPEQERRWDLGIESPDHTHNVPTYIMVPWSKHPHYNAIKVARLPSSRLEQSPSSSALSLTASRCKRLSAWWRMLHLLGTFLAALDIDTIARPEHIRSMPCFLCSQKSLDAAVCRAHGLSTLAEQQIEHPKP